jgi:Zn-dependent peptidase ImmA (M78 family)
MTEAVVRQQAAKLLEQLRITEPPVNVEDVAARVGLRVEHKRLLDGLSGRLLRERMVVEVNSTHARNRKRFTIAHEIGHLLLKHSNVVCAADRWTAADPRRVNERQANAFASELLMPELWIRARWPDVHDYRAMATLFEVSPEAMFLRLQDASIL